MIAAPLTFDLGVRAAHRPLRWMLLGGIALITLAHLVITWAPAGTWPDALVDMVHVDREHNIPTWFSSAELLTLAAGFLGLLFHERFSRRRRLATVFWAGCAALSLFLSMDETAEIHEALGGVAGEIFRSAAPGTMAAWLGTFPSYYWALVYVPVAVPCGLVFSWFALREMVGVRLLAISGLVVFGLGAVVLDHLEGRFGNAAHEHLRLAIAGQALRFDVFLLEELLEMLGVFLLIEAVFRQLFRVSREHPLVEA